MLVSFHIFHTYIKHAFIPEQSAHSDLGSPDQLILPLLHILLLALPRRQDGRLQRAPVAEAERPRAASLSLVDGVQVDRRLLLTLTAGQKRDAWNQSEQNLREPTRKRKTVPFHHERLSMDIKFMVPYTHARANAGVDTHTGHSGRNGPPQRLHRRLGNLLGRVLGGAALSGRHHVGLEKRPLQVHVVVSQRLVLERQHLQGNNQSMTTSLVVFLPDYVHSIWQKSICMDMSDRLE